MAEKQWFESWFDTSYYHILYKNRNDKEAQQFMTQLMSYLKIEKHHHLLDLACGKGRHSFFIDSLDYNIEGCDLSKESIDFANKKATGKPHFFVHDMRNELKANNYDFILNLFTSFGYFEDIADNLKVFKAIKAGLKPDGKAVIDFLNAKFVTDNIVFKETKEIEDISFEITREVTSDHIIKNINFNADGKNHSYQEKVQSLNITDFQYLAKESGLNIDATFGDYELNPFDNVNSKRLILILSHE